MPGVHHGARRSIRCAYFQFLSTSACCPKTSLTRSSSGVLGPCVPQYFDFITVSLLAHSSPHPGDCIPGRSLSWSGWGVYGSLLPAVFIGTPINCLDILPPHDLIARAQYCCFSNSCLLMLLFLLCALPVQVCGSSTFSREVIVGDALHLARFRGQEGCCLGAVHPPHLFGSTAICHSQSSG